MIPQNIDLTRNLDFSGRSSNPDFIVSPMISRVGSILEHRSIIEDLSSRIFNKQIRYWDVFHSSESIVYGIGICEMCGKPLKLIPWKNQKELCDECYEELAITSDQSINNSGFPWTPRLRTITSIQDIFL